MTRLLLMTLAVAAVGVSPAGGADEGYWQPGGYEGRIGSPYYYSLPAERAGRLAVPAGHPTAFSAPSSHHGCACSAWGRYAHGWGHQNASHFIFGSYSYNLWATGGDPYSWHFGPGFYRHAEHGHFRFPYYSYRRPWYYPGQPIFNRDTNFAW